MKQATVLWENNEWQGGVTWPDAVNHLQSCAGIVFLLYHGYLPTITFSFFFSQELHIQVIYL